MYSSRGGGTGPSTGRLGLPGEEGEVRGHSYLRVLKLRPVFDFWWDGLERSVRVKPGQVLSFLSSCYTIKPAGWHPRGREQKAPRASERPR